MGLSLQQAADRVGCSKSQIHRAVRSGKLSAARGEGGTFSIDESELARVFPPTRSRDEAATRGDTAPDTPDTVDRLRLAVLESETRMLRDRLAELKVQCDRWAAEAERLSSRPLMLPAPSETAPKRHWWQRKSA